MRHRYLLFLLGLLSLTALACFALMGEPPTSALTAEATAVATPTAAPTLTLDPFFELTPTAVATANQIAGVATPTLAVPGGQGNNNSVGSNNDNNNPGTPGSDTTPAGNDPGSGNNGNNSSSGSAACPAAGKNLLIQGGFEGPYEAHGFVNELNVPPPWIPWFFDDGAINFRPEYKPADGVNFPNRVRTGSSAQVYFKSYGQFRAGVYQQVINIRTGTRLQFSAFGQGWSCADFSQCGGGVSHNPANMYMRVGIDPHGRSNPSSIHIVWSEYFNPIDRWEARCVETVALHDVVTVYLAAAPDGPRQNQDVYWDDASLVELP
jgi:hypothetical protein